MRFAGQKLNFEIQQSLACSSRKIIYPLPNEWQTLFQKHGLNVARRRCSALFSFKIFCIWAFGVLQILGHITQQICGLKRLYFKKQFSKSRPYIFFDMLNAENINSTEKRGVFDIISWYSQWKGRENDVRILRHNCKEKKLSFERGDTLIEYQSGPTPTLRKINDLCHFICWGAATAFLSCIHMVCGRWWYGLLLYQAPLAALFRLSDSNEIAKHYYFHQNGMFVRRLWTYEAEHRGAGISLYFYSTNSETHKTKNGYLTPMYGFRLMNWPRYLVWNSFHADFIKRSKNSTYGNVEVVGQIWFADNGKPLPQLPEKFFSIFDTTPIRPSVYAKLGLDNQYLTYSTVNQFLNDILLVSKNLNFHIAIKPKRVTKTQANNRYDNRYSNKIERMAKCSLVTTVDPGISAQRLIEASEVVISLPFSTTAIIAMEMKKPTVFYDPFGKAFPDDRAAYGIQIISGRQQLEKWIKKLKITNC